MEGHLSLNMNMINMIQKGTNPTLYYPLKYLNCWTPSGKSESFFPTALEGPVLQHPSIGYAFCQIRRWLKKHPIIPLVQSLSTGWLDVKFGHQIYLFTFHGVMIQSCMPYQYWKQCKIAMPITAWGLMFQQNHDKSWPFASDKQQSLVQHNKATGTNNANIAP